MQILSFKLIYLGFRVSDGGGRALINGTTCALKHNAREEGTTKRNVFLQLLQHGGALPLGGRRIAADFLSQAVPRSVAIHFAED